MKLRFPHKIQISLSQKLVPCDIPTREARPYPPREMGVDNGDPKETVEGNISKLTAVYAESMAISAVSIAIRKHEAARHWKEEKKQSMKIQIG